MAEDVSFDRDAVLAAAGPRLAELQREARDAARMLKGVFALAAALPVLFIAGMFGLGIGALVVPFFLVMIVAIVVIGLRAAKRIFAARSKVLEAIAPALGMTYGARAEPPIDLSAFDGTYYASLMRYARCDDVLSGARNGAAFAIFDAKVTARSKGPDGEWRYGHPPKWLEGVAFHVTRVVRVDVPGRWTSRTVILRDAGLANRLQKPKGMERVGLVDPKFEKVFEVYSTDQTEARALLDPAVMERLMRLEDLFVFEGTGEDAPPPAVVVFDGGRLYAALPFDRFRGASADPRRLKVGDVDKLVVQVLFDEIDAVLGVVDAVAGAERS